MSSSNIGFDDDTWDEEFNELQVINDMVLIQRFILENIEQEVRSNSFGNMTINSTNEFPSLGISQTPKQQNRNVLNEMYKDKHVKKEKLYKQSIQNYFYQEPIMELPQNTDKNWRNYYGELAFKSTVG